MTNSTDTAMISTSGDISQVQTPENTLAPFEPIPAAAAPDPAPPAKRKWVRPPRTKAYREMKAREREQLGIAKPGPKSKEELAAIAPAPAPRSNRADHVLKALVDRLVALENDDQYRGVWTHFFVHGGVYNGPRYIDELTAAIAYLQSVGK